MIRDPSRIAARQPFGSLPEHRPAAEYVERGDVPRARASLLEVLHRNPSDAAAHSHLLFLSHYDEVDAGEIFRMHRQWGQIHAAFPGFPHFPARSRRKLRIGYVSPHLREGNPLMFFVEPVLRAHDRERFDIWCYLDVRRPDAGTRRIQALADQWRDITGDSDEQFAARVRSDGIDILMDLAGHLPGNRLTAFARRAAPVQITWIGYPDTTGVPAMDYRLTDDFADPPGESERYHTEQLLRLPTGFLCYQPPAGAPPVSALPAWLLGHITFGSFQYPGKITSEAIGAWAALLRRVPNSRLLLHHCFSDYAGSGDVKHRILARFAEGGIEQGRMDFVGGVRSLRQHLELHGRVDIALDTFPYHGTTSTCEALWMGVPVVTLRGSTHAARVGVSLLSRVGLAHLVTGTVDEYVEAAVRLASDLNWLARARASLRTFLRRSALLDAPRFTRALEEEYVRITSEV